MRTFLAFSLCALAIPCAASAQAAPPSADGRQLAPDQPLFSDPVTPPPAAVTAAPAPAIEAAKITPPAPDGPTTVAPVLVEAKPDQAAPSDMTRKIGVSVGGLLGGVAGAAGGPVGKFAGSFVGKRVARSLLDRSKGPDTPQLEVTQVSTSPGAPSAADAGKPALADPATAPALVATSAPRPATEP